MTPIYDSDGDCDCYGDGEVMVWQWAYDDYDHDKEGWYIKLGGRTMVWRMQGPVNGFASWIVSCDPSGWGDNVDDDDDNDDDNDTYLIKN